MTQAGPGPEERRPCPFCGEAILAVAAVCRFCRRDLPGGWADPLLHESITRIARGFAAKGGGPPPPGRRPPQVRPSLAVVLMAVVLAMLALSLAAPKTSSVSGTTEATSEKTEPPLDPLKPVYLREETMICPEIMIMGAYLDGHRAGGEAAGHRAVADLFIHPRGDCIRTIGRDRVRVLELSPGKLAKIEYEAGLPAYMALPGDLSN
jgi:hypothetical protein